MTLVPELFVRRLNKPKGLPINVRDVSVTGDGQTDDYAALNEAVRSAGATGTLYFPAGTYVVGTNLTIPACCIFAFGAKLKPSAGITVTLSGPVEFAPGESVIATGTAGTVSITGSIESSGGVLDVRAFGAVGDGVTDDTAAIQRALNAGRKVLAPAGFTFSVLSLSLPTETTLYATGATFVKRAGAVGTHILDAAGSLSATTTLLTGNVAENAASVPVTSVTGLAVGDVVLIRDDTYAYSTLGRNQELARIIGFDTLNVLLDHRTIRSYTTAANATLIKVNAVENAAVIGGSFKIESGDNGGCIAADLAYGLTIEVEKCSGFNDDPGVLIERSGFVTVTGGQIRDGQNIDDAGYGYGVMPSESAHNVLVQNTFAQNIREYLANNGARYVSFIGNTVTGAEVAAINTHGAGVRYCLIANNTVTACKQDGIAAGQISTPDAGDSDVQIIGNIVSNVGRHGIRSSSTDTIENSNILISGNIVSGFGTADVNSYGIFVVQTEGFSVLGNQVTDPDAVATAAVGIYATASEDGAIQSNTIVGGVTGIRVNDATDVTVRANAVRDVSSNTYRSTGTNTRVAFIGNDADTTNRVWQATDVAMDNVLAGIVGASADRGNASQTIVWGADYPTQVFSTTLTANRNLSLSTSNATVGAKFRVVRPAAGAFNLNVGTGPLKALAAGQWCEVEWNGAAWFLSSFGSL